MKIKWSDNITLFDSNDKEDIAILIVLAILFGPSLISFLGDNGQTNYMELKVPSSVDSTDKNIRPDPTVIVPVIVPKPTPELLFDVDVDTKAILYKKDDCSIFIKDPTKIVRQDAEVGNCTDSNWVDVKERLPNIVPTVVPTVTVVPTPVVGRIPGIANVPPQRGLTISELDNIFKNLNKKGWNQLYQLNEFDCSRMSSYWQIVLERDYGIKTEIVQSDSRQANSRYHAWIAVRISDFGDYDSTYIKWTDKDGIGWYYIESTVPEIVRYNVVRFYNEDWQAIDFYNAKDVKFLGDYDDAVRYWQKEYELTDGDIQKVTNFMQ